MGPTGVHNAGPAIGIDLGTTYSCVGYWRAGRVEIIPNDQGNRTTPSAVAFTDKDRLVGDAAQNQAASNPLSTVFDAKRLMGRKFKDETVQSDIKLWPFKVVSNKGRPMICVTYKGKKKEFAPEEISSMILTKMKHISEAYIGSEVNNAVVTVPAYFDQLQRASTVIAGKIAGLNILSLIAEPTAAAIAYGLDNAAKAKRNVLIFDLGGGTFDVSILTVENGKIEVKATCGDTHLGGEDFDNRMVNYYVKEFKARYQKDISGNPKSLRRLRTACERAKRMLSSTTETKIEIDGLFNGIDFSTVLTRARFEEMNLDLFKKCIEMVNACLMDAKMDKNALNDVVLVGGSSRIPKVQQLLSSLLNGKDLCKDINPDEAVAYGAAVQAAILSGEKDEKIEDLVLTEVTPLSLGINVRGDVMYVVIPKNTPIPAKIERGVSTTVDYTISTLIEVCEGERAKATNNIHLGDVVLSGIQRALRGVPKLGITFELEASGVLKVTVKDKVTGSENSITIQHGTLTKQEVKMMVKKARMFEEEDALHRKKHEANLDFVRAVYKLREKISGNSTLSSSAEKAKVEDAVKKAFKWLDAKEQLREVHEYKQKKKELEMIMESTSEGPYTRFSKFLCLAN